MCGNQAEGVPVGLVGDQWDELCFPAVTSASEKVEIVSQMHVFTKSNFHLSPEWDRILRSDISVTIDKDKAIAAIDEAVGGGGERLQKEFVELLAEVLDRVIGTEQQRQLCEVSLQNGYPDYAGLFALAVGLKEAAKGSYIRIAPKDRRQIVSTTGKAPEFDTSDYPWLRIVCASEYSQI